VVRSDLLGGGKARKRPLEEPAPLCASFALRLKGKPAVGAIDKWAPWLAAPDPNRLPDQGLAGSGMETALCHARI